MKFSRENRVLDKSLWGDALEMCCLFKPGQWLIISYWKRFQNGPQCIMRLTVNLAGCFFSLHFLRRLAKFRDNFKTCAYLLYRYDKYAVLSIRCVCNGRACNSYNNNNIQAYTVKNTPRGKIIFGSYKMIYRVYFNNKITAIKLWTVFES